MVKNSGEKAPTGFALGKENLRLMLVGLVLIIIGFVLMTGGRSSDPNVFSKDVIFSFRRITLAPLVVMFGFLFEIYAIMKKPKSEN